MYGRFRIPIIEQSRHLFQGLGGPQVTKATVLTGGVDFAA